jgi:surface protein
MNSFHSFLSKIKNQIQRKNEILKERIESKDANTERKLKIKNSFINSYKDIIDSNHFFKKYKSLLQIQNRKNEEFSTINKKDKKEKLIDKSSKRINKKNIILISRNNVFLFLIYNIIIINLIFIVGCQSYKINRNRYIHLANQITIKIVGNNKQNILNSGFQYKPNEILLNGNPISIDSENKIDIIDEEENTVIMKWNIQLEDCTDMFSELENIIDIDLSNFDSSKVETMNRMFYGCTNIKYIKMFEENNYLDTSSVKNMAGMFQLCESLISLDLSKFSTS